VECRLGEILEEQGRMITWLAKTVNINRNTVTSLIKGSEPKLKMAREIAKALDTTVDHIWPPVEEPFE
jgi:DNA-binding XRE family transcriptional regulator